MYKNLAVLVSGSGTLLDAIVADKIPVALVMADRPCLGLDKAMAYGIPATLLPRVEFGRGENFDREAYTERVVGVLQEHGIDFISMAGWMTIFDEFMFTVYQDRIINNHPALLPDFKGDDAVADALAAGVSVTGCTIHVATLALDDGPILAQQEVEVLPGDDEGSLHERIKQAERPLLCRVLREQLGLPAHQVA